VFQSYALYPHMTVAGNIEFPLRSRHVDHAERHRLVREVAESLGLQDLLDRKPAELSGGQRQRVGVARALAVDPPLLLLDEPFGALDPVTRVELQQQFLDLRERLNTTALLVTHDVREALLLGTRIGVLHNGRLVFLGGRSEFLEAHDQEVRAFHVCLEERWRGTT
jgi:ABC-type proline/glycine betaine transport system ATPase subunit